MAGVATIDRKRFAYEGSGLSVLTAGPAAGESAVLLHGIPEGAEVWRSVLNDLGEAGYRALAPDLPGYGLTRLPAGGDYSLSATAALLSRWLSHEGIDRAWVIGHDIGGIVAQMLAVRHPHLVGCLTISNTPVERSWPVTPVRLFRFIARLHLYVPAAALRLVPNPYAWRALRQSFADPSKLDPDAARRVFWDTKATDPRGRREFERHLAALDNAETLAIATDLQKINVPTLLLWGRADTYLPWNTVGERLRTLMPGADVQLIDGAGHVPHLETPTAYAEALLRWRRACRP